MKKWTALFLFFCFILAPLCVQSTIMVGKKAPCPICGWKVDYSELRSTFSMYDPDLHEPFYQLTKRFYLFFHCRHCGFSLSVGHFRSLTDENPSLLSQKTKDEIRNALQSSDLVEKLDAKTSTPLALQYALMERVYRVLTADKALVSGLDINKDQLWRILFTDMALILFMEGNMVSAKEYAAKALPYHWRAPRGDGPDWILDRKEYLLRYSPLKFFAGETRAALSGYWEALQLMPREKDEDAIDSSLWLDNCIAKDVSYILDSRQSPGWLVRLQGLLILAVYVIRVRPMVMLWLFLFGIVSFSVLFVLRDRNPALKKWRWRRFLSWIFSLAIPALVYLFARFFLRYESYFAFLAVSGFWALMVVFAERYFRVRLACASLFDSRSWAIARLSLVFSPLVMGIFHLKNTFLWLPILFPLRAFDGMYHRLDMDYGQLYFHGIIFFASLLILCWLILSCIQQARSQERSPSIFKQARNAFFYSGSILCVIIFIICWYVIFKNLIGHFFHSYFPLVFFLAVGITWLYLLWIFNRFLVRPSKSNRSFFSVYRRLLSKKACRWAYVVIFLIPIGIWGMNRFLEF